MTATTTRPRNLLVAALVGTLTMGGLATQAIAQQTRVDQLAERALNRRAIEAVIWGMPVSLSMILDGICPFF
jgi:hypothetical protein